MARPSTGRQAKMLADALERGEAGDSGGPVAIDPVAIDTDLVADASCPLPSDAPPGVGEAEPRWPVRYPTCLKVLALPALGLLAWLAVSLFTRDSLPASPVYGEEYGNDGKPCTYDVHEVRQWVFISFALLGFAVVEHALLLLAPPFTRLSIDVLSGRYGSCLTASLVVALKGPLYASLICAAAVEVKVIAFDFVDCSMHAAIFFNPATYAGCVSAFMIGLTQWMQNLFLSNAKEPPPPANAIDHVPDWDYVPEVPNTSLEYCGGSRHGSESSAAGSEGEGCDQTGVSIQPECCPICLVDFVPGDQLKRTQCDHVFHRECLAGWLAKRRTCAMCRQDIVTGPPRRFSELSMATYFSV